MNGQSFDVTLNFNEEKNGIELKFDQKPPQEVLSELSGNNFRWHKQKKLWYAKISDERISFAEKLLNSVGRELPKREGMNTRTDSQEQETKTTASTRTSKAKPAAKKEVHTMADFTDEIGHSHKVEERLGDRSIHLMDPKHVYYKEENIHLSVYGLNYNVRDDRIYITDLENAQKSGASCPCYRISNKYGGTESLDQKLSDAGIHTVKELLDAFRTNSPVLETLKEGAYIDVAELKGMEVFSPFLPEKPLKAIPEKWTKRNLAQALLSGQIYKAVQDYSYTDDYAYDAASHFGEGRPIDVADLAKDVIEDWGKTTSVYGRDLDPSDATKTTISLSPHSNKSYTLFFDLNMNLKTAKEYRDNEAAARDRFNANMEASVIKPTWNSFQPDKVYTMELLVRDTNTGLYGTKSEPIQGFHLRNKLREAQEENDWNYISGNLIGVSERELKPDLFYTIKNGHLLSEDERVIESNPHQCVVSGKAIQELSAEGTFLEGIGVDRPNGRTYDEIHTEILNFATGKHSFLFCDKVIDYALSSSRLDAEHKRAKEANCRAFDEIVGEAEKKSQTQAMNFNHQAKVVQFPGRTRD